MGKIKSTICTFDKKDCLMRGEGGFCRGLTETPLRATEDGVICPFYKSTKEMSAKEILDYQAESWKDGYEGPKPEVTALLQEKGAAIAKEMGLWS